MKVKNVRMLNEKRVHRKAQQFLRSPPDTPKKSNHSVWKGALARRKAGLFLKYPGESMPGLMFDGSVYEHLLTTFSPLATQPEVHPPCVLKVPEAGCSLFLACARLGLGYLGYQTKPATVEYILQYAAPIVKQALGEEHWPEWVKVQLALLPAPVPLPKPSPVSASSSSKRKRLMSESPASSSSKRKKRQESSSSSSSASSPSSSSASESSEEEMEEFEEEESQEL
jgi:hypothetical protein